MCRKLWVFAACLAMLSAPLAGADAHSRTKMHYRHYAKQAYGCPLHRAVDGTLVDCQGWRLRNNAIGWDPSCLNLDYLPSEFACSGGRR
jgi:hypothetical protein